MTKRLGAVIYAMRWILYPLDLVLFTALGYYVLGFFFDAYSLFSHPFTHDMEFLMVALLGLVDAAMVANLIVMIIQGSHQIFIHKLETEHDEDRPQWLDHIDSGILKVKVALSIAGITLIRILKDFVNLENLNWTVVVHRMVIHGVALCSALIMAWIWRVTHPTGVLHEK